MLSKFLFIVPSGYFLLNLNSNFPNDDPSLESPDNPFHSQAEVTLVDNVYEDPLFEEDNFMLGSPVNDYELDLLLGSPCVNTGTFSYDASGGSLLNRCQWINFTPLVTASVNEAISRPKMAVCLTRKAKLFRYCGIFCASSTSCARVVDL